MRERCAVRSAVVGVGRGFATNHYVVAHFILIVIEGNNYERILRGASTDSALPPR
jgi:hypothetical protein